MNTIYAAKLILLHLLHMLSRLNSIRDSMTPIWTAGSLIRDCDLLDLINPTCITLPIQDALCINIGAIIKLHVLEIIRIPLGMDTGCY